LSTLQIKQVFVRQHLLAISMLNNANIAELHMLLRRIPEGLINPDPRHYARE
jgi:hypothetical protein